MAELNLEIVYRPGMKNIAAGVLSQYGVDGVAEAIASAWYSLGDSSVMHVVYEWLSVVTKHLDFDACVTATVEALSQ